MVRYFGELADYCDAAGATAASGVPRASRVAPAPVQRARGENIASICRASVVPYLASHAGDATAISTAFGARFDAADAPDALLEPALHDLAKYNAAKLDAICSNLGGGFGDASRERCLRFKREGMFGSGADYRWGVRAGRSGCAVDVLH